jgi:hypothetical protein
VIDHSFYMLSYHTTTLQYTPHPTGQISVAEQRKKNMVFNSQNVVAKVEPSLIDRIFTQSRYLQVCAWVFI